MIRFESWGEFVVMDGHGSYVLAAYAIGAKRFPWESLPCLLLSVRLLRQTSF